MHNHDGIESPEYGDIALDSVNDEQMAAPKHTDKIRYEVVERLGHRATYCKGIWTWLYYSALGHLGEGSIQ